MKLLLRNIIVNLGLRKYIVWFRHQSIRDDDILIASYPKSGNTWIRFMLATIITKGEVDFDSVGDVIPEMEKLKKAKYVEIDGRRFVKTHERYWSCYKSAVYVVRDARDVAVSYYHHMKRKGTIDCSFREYLELFTKGKLDGYGTWGENVESWLKNKDNDKKIILLKYEDLLANPHEKLREMLDYFGINVTEDTLRIAIEANEFSRMKKKEANSEFFKKDTKNRKIAFMRSGKNDQWRDYLGKEEQSVIETCFGETMQKFNYIEAATGK